MNFLVRPPQFLRNIYKDACWRMNENEKVIYLTFDDGPIPELTPWVLEILNKYQVKATFFCVGENISKNPDIYQQIINNGNQVGNHTYNHIKGWKTKTDDYLKNVELCQKLTKTNLFRPPYGRITKNQIKSLKNSYKIILWDVLSYDYDKYTTPKKCLDNCIKYTRNGSIIVFHDNIKAKDSLKYALPLYIEHFLKLNYKFATL